MKETADLYRIHTERGEWAHIFLTEGRRKDDGNYWGTISVVSSYGEYGFIWSHMGCPLRVFLKNLTFDYAMGKFRSSAVYIFDFYETIKALKELVTDSYTGKEDKEILDVLQEIEDEGPCIHDELLRQITDELPDFANSHDIWEIAETMPDPQCKGFWDTIWPLMLAEFEKEKQNS